MADLRLVQRSWLVTLIVPPSLGLAFLFGSIEPADAVPKSTSTKQYCGCTCGNSFGTKFLYWEKRYSCNLADNGPCTMTTNTGEKQKGTLHSCMDCTRDESGGFNCRNQGMAPGGGARVPSTGKLEQVVPRGIEGAQEIEPPPVESGGKGK
jgi:hypothetical protein